MKNEIQTYSSLGDIRLRKSKIKKEITDNEKEIAMLWKSLFRSDSDKAFQTPSKKITNFLKTGAGLLDGIILGWKLYRRFVR
jgi:hypothetical protein